MLVLEQLGGFEVGAVGTELLDFVGTLGYQSLQLLLGLQHVVFGVLELG